MLSDNMYESFFSSSFLSECRLRGMTITGFFDFVNSFLGVENFIHNHPKPVIEYYWELKGGESIKQIANKFNVTLKRPKFVNIGDNDVKIESDEYPVYPPDSISYYGPECYGGINAIKGKICRAAIVADLKSLDIIQNETLWEDCELLRDESYSNRHSSEEYEYYSFFKTGWSYLVDNKNVILDSMLIPFLKNRNITLKKEQVDEYAGYRFGVNQSPKEVVNGLMAFRMHPIDKNIVPIIMNDPIQWEGIFYDQNFCNNSILEYIVTLKPSLEDVL